MQRIWERSQEERKKKQDGNVREFLIGCYAPREPLVMDGVLRFLKYERKYPLSLVHKIIDRFASMTITTTVVTHDEIVHFIKGIPEDFAIVRGPCACRIHTADMLGPDARDLSSGNLDFCRQTPLNVDIQIAKSGEKFGELDSYSPISREGLIDLEEECFNMGLVANIYVMMGGEAGICHCSYATCVPFLANEAIQGTSTVIRKGRFVASTSEAACKGTANCTKVCHFKARHMKVTKGRPHSTVDPMRCYGCGLCAAVCPEKAISLVPRRREKNRDNRF